MDFKTELEGLGFPEGPVAIPGGGIAFVDLKDRCLRLWRPGAEPQVLARIPGSPNGLRLGADGHWYIANNGGVAPLGPGQYDFAQPMIAGCIQRITAEGEVLTLTSALPGDGTVRPNDLCFTADGGLLFTDSQNWEEIDFHRIQPDGSVPGYGGGRVYYRSRDGKVRLLAQVEGFANGICLHPDGSVLVALTLARRILKFPWNGRELGEPVIWCQFEDAVMPDGIAIHGQRLYAAGAMSGLVAMVDLDGRRVGSLATDGLPTNLCISDGRLWVTVGLPGRLLSCPLPA